VLKKNVMGGDKLDITWKKRSCLDSSDSLLCRNFTGGFEKKHENSHQAIRCSAANRNGRLPVNATDVSS